MPILNTQNQYGLIAIVLHWLSAASVLTLFALGWWMVRLGYYDPWYTIAPYWHKGLGILFTLVLLLRIVWKLVNTSPVSINLSNRLHHIVLIVHWILYGLLLLIIVSGYLITTADGRALDVFGWFEIPATITSLSNQESLMGLWHRWAAYVLMFLVFMHIMAALKHHFINRDATLKRMFGKSIK